MSKIRDLITAPENLKPHNDTLDFVTNVMAGMMDDIKVTSLVTQPHAIYVDEKPQQAVAYRGRTITTDQVVGANHSFLEALANAQYNGAAFSLATHCAEGQRNAAYDMVCNIAQRLLYCVSSTNPAEYMAGDVLPIIRGTWAVYARSRELLMDAYPADWLKKSQNPLFHLFKKQGNTRKHELTDLVTCTDEFIKGLATGNKPKSKAVGVGTREWWRDYITAMDSYYSNNTSQQPVIHSALRTWSKYDTVDLYMGGLLTHHYTGHPTGYTGGDINKSLETKQITPLKTDWIAPCDMCISMIVTEPLTGQSVTMRARASTNNELLYAIYQLRDQLYWLAKRIEDKSAPAKPRLQVTVTVSMHPKVV